MWDAVLLILLANVGWAHGVAVHGFPLAFAVFAALWCTDGLPHPVYSYRTPPLTFASDVASLLLMIDVTQTAVHVMAHTRLKHTLLGRSHRIHHERVVPTPQDAFHTGIIDALMQLVLPLVAAVHAIRPSRGALILFGALYSNWLHYLHSGTGDPRVLRKLGLVTPAMHARHHTHPGSYMSTLVAWI